MEFRNKIHYLEKPNYRSGIKVVSEWCSFVASFREYQDAKLKLTIGCIPLASSSFIRLL